MGFQKTSIGWFDYNEHLCLPNTSDNTFDELKFQSDWNWMIPLIRRIQEVCEEPEEIDYLRDTLWFGTIGDVYKDCIEFIINYNTTENEQY